MAEGQLEAFTREMRKRLEKAGVTHTAFDQRAGGSGRASADAFITRLGYHPIGKAWIEREREQARHELAGRMTTSLAYRSRMLSPSDALEVADAFIALFDAASSRFFTNWRDNGWSPVSESTFDAAFIAMDGASIGLILIEDED